MEAIFFNGWSVLGRTLLIGVLAYVSLVFMLRVSGEGFEAPRPGCDQYARARLPGNGRDCAQCLFQVAG